MKTELKSSIKLMFTLLTCVQLFSVEARASKTILCAQQLKSQNETENTAENLIAPAIESAAWGHRFGRMSVQMRARVIKMLNNLFSKGDDSRYINNRSLVDYLGHFRSQHDDPEYQKIWWSSGSTPNIATPVKSNRVFSLIRSLVRLSSKSHILELGTGKEGIQTALDAELAKPTDRDNDPYYYEKTFFLNWLQSAERPNYTGISLEGKKLETAKTNVLIGFFENTPAEELIRKFGHIDVLIEDFGVFSYTFNIKETAEKVASVSRPGADLWVFGDRNVFILPDGKTVGLAEVLSSSGAFEQLLPNKLDKSRQFFLLRRTDKEMEFPQVELVKLETLGKPYTKNWKILDLDFKINPKEIDLDRFIKPGDVVQLKNNKTGEVLEIFISRYEDYEPVDEYSPNRSEIGFKLVGLEKGSQVILQLKISSAPATFTVMQIKQRKFENIHDHKGEIIAE